MFPGHEVLFLIYPVTCNFVCVTRALILSFWRPGLIVADIYDPLNPNGTAQGVKSVIPAARPPIIGRFEIIKGPNHSDKTNTSLVVEGIPPGTSHPTQSQILPQLLSLLPIHSQSKSLKHILTPCQTN